MLRAYGRVFCSTSLLSVYMCVRVHLSSRSVAGVLSSCTLLVFPSHHLCAFLINGCMATKQQKNGYLGDSEQKSKLNKLKICDTDFRKKIIISSDNPNPVPGPFSEIQCDKFRSQTAPHSRYRKNGNI